MTGRWTSRTSSNSWPSRSEGEKPIVATSTRRGLVLGLYSEGPLVVGALIFILFPSRDVFLWTGIVLSVFIGGPGGLITFAGRNEFGPAHAKNIVRTMILFPAMLGAIGLAYLQVHDIFPQTLRVADLYAPLAFLALAIILDQTILHFLLWQLAGDDGRKWIRIGWAWATILALALLAYGAPQVAEFIERSGGAAANSVEAKSYAEDFTRTVVRAFAGALVLLRITFWPPLYKAISNVAEAENAPEPLGN